MNALRVFILTLLLLAPGSLRVFCGDACGTAACPKAAPFAAQADQPGSCCSPEGPDSLPCSPFAPLSPQQCCCVQAPIDTPRAPAPVPQQAPEEQPGAELPRAWTPLAAYDDFLLRVPRAAALSPPAWTPGGGNPIQSVLCTWRN